MLSDKYKTTGEKFIYPILIIIGIVYLFEAWRFPGSFQGGDGMKHFLTSKYSWHHPGLFLFLWGKPFFTIISSPFSQFGLLGIKVFNIICALFSGYLVFKIATELKMKNAILATIFLLFTPFYYFGTNSGYTEVFFGLIVVFTIYEYIKGRYFWSTILISLLPFVRSEGYLLLPLFFAILVLRKKYSHVLLLGFGNVIYSIIGYFYYKDLFWIHTQNPYDGHMAEIYGHGPLLHFINGGYWVWGKPLIALIISGLIYGLIKLFRKDKLEVRYKAEEYILIYGSGLVYFIAHSIFWWKGLFNSLGLERVLIAIIPVSALIALRGINFIISPIPKIVFSRIVILFFLVFIVLSTYRHDTYPLKLDPEEDVVLKMKDWYINSGFKNRNIKMFYLHPYMPEALSFDPFDTEKIGELWGMYPALKKYGYDGMPDSSLILWDAHYGTNEAELPIDTLLNDNHFRLIKAFQPDAPLNVLGNVPFGIYVFQKIKPENNITDTISIKKYDFENDSDIVNTSAITSNQAYSGVRSSEFTSDQEYGPSIIQHVNTLRNIDAIQCITLGLKITSAYNFEALAILSTHKGDQQTGWHSFPIKYITDGDKWKNITGHWIIDTSILKEADFIKIYLWNKNRKSFFADDFEIKFLNRCN